MAALLGILADAQIDFTQNGRSYIMGCPICEKKGKLFIRKTDGRFVCWVCKETQRFEGRPEFALHELTGRSIGELQGLLYGEVQAVPSDTFLTADLRDFFDGEEDDDEEQEDWPVVAWPLDYYPLDKPQAAKGVAYLEKRGVPAAIASQYGVRYSPSNRRVVFPVESQGNLLGWQERAVYKTEWIDPDTGEKKSIPKVLSSKSLSGIRDQVLMFGDRIKTQKAVITEGPFDAIKCHLIGDNAATMGKAVSSGQLQLLRRMGVKDLYLGLDEDAAEEISRIAKEMGDLNVYHLETPRGYEDLGEAPFEANLEAFHSARQVTGANLFFYLKPYFPA